MLGYKRELIDTPLKFNLPRREISQSLCKTNQLIGLYMIGTLLNKLTLD